MLVVAALLYRKVSPIANMDLAGLNGIEAFGEANDIKATGVMGVAAVENPPVGLTAAFLSCTFNESVWTRRLGGILAMRALVSRFARVAVLP